MLLFAETGPWTMLFLAGLMLISWVLLRRTQRYYSRNRPSETPPEYRLQPPREPAGLSLNEPETAARWEVQLHETARELSAQLDSKMSALQALILDADRAAARLEAAMGKAGSPAESPRAAANQAEIYTLADYGFDAAQIAGRIGAPIGEVQLILGLRDKR